MPLPMKCRINAAIGWAFAVFTEPLVETIELSGSLLVAAGLAECVIFALSSRRVKAAAAHMSGVADGVSAGVFPDAAGTIPNQASTPAAAVFAGRGAEMAGVAAVAAGGA